MLIAQVGAGPGLPESVKAASDIHTDEKGNPEVKVYGLVVRTEKVI